MIKEFNVILCVLIVLGSIHSSYVTALPFIDDTDDIDDDLDGNFIDRAPTADDIGELWMHSFLNKTIYDRNRYEIDGEIQPRIFRDSFHVKDDWMVKKYCVVTKKTKNCMEVGLNPTKENFAPFEIRLPASPKVIKKVKKFQTDEDLMLKKKRILKHYKNYYKTNGIIRKIRAPGLREEKEKETNALEPYDDNESYEDDDEYDYDYDEESDEYYYEPDFRRVMKPYDKHNMTDEKKMMPNIGQVAKNHTFREKKKRSLSHEGSEDKYFKKNNNLDTNGRVKRSHYSYSSGESQYSQSISGESLSDYHHHRSSDSMEDLSLLSGKHYSSDSIEDPTQLSGAHYDSSKSSSSKSSYSNSHSSKSSYSKSHSGSSKSLQADPLLDSNPSRSRSGDALDGSEEDSPYLWYNCRLPDHSSNAEILCKKWNQAMSCNMYCAHGYTFKEGIVRKTHCQFKEGKWTKKFEQCQPFIDCSVMLEGPGSLFCTTHHLKKGTTCDITCGKSSKEDSTSKKEHTCSKEGRWSPSLPHCANHEGIDVVKPPAETEHGELAYPDKYPSFTHSKSGSSSSSR